MTVSLFQGEYRKLDFEWNDIINFGSEATPHEQLNNFKIFCKVMNPGQTPQKSKFEQVKNTDSKANTPNNSHNKFTIPRRTPETRKLEGKFVLYNASDSKTNTPKSEA